MSKAKYMNIPEEGNDYDAAIDAFKKAFEMDPAKGNFHGTFLIFCFIGKKD